MNNKTIEFVNASGNKVKTTYGNIIEECITPAKSGEGAIPMSEIRKRIEIKKKLKNNPMKLSKEDLSTVKRCVKNMKWGLIDENIVEFADYVESF